MNVDPNILRKIQKCLALASSPVPGEAEAAMRQAQKLMDIHGVDDGHLARAEVGEKMIQGQKGQNPSSWETRLVWLCCRAFGAKPLWSHGPKGGQGKWGNGWWTFVGPKNKIELIVYTYTVLLRQVLKARAEFVSKMPYNWTRVRKAAEGDAFCDSFVYQLDKKVSDALNDPKVTEAINAHAKEITDRNQNPKGVKIKSNGEGSMYATILGAEAGQKASFHNAAGGPTARQQLGRNT